LAGEDLNKAGERAVVDLLHLRREDAGGKLIRLKVVGDALAAFAFSGAWLVGARALGFININLAFHLVSLSFH
jgi:hypothetical protein